MNSRRQAVEVWRCSPSAMRLVDIRQFERILTAGERQRAAGFAFEGDRQRFIIARAALRSILSPYLEVEPAGVRFTANAFGKPELAGAPPKDALRFNVSYRDDVILCAVTRGHAVGVDVERIRPGIEFEALSNAFFSPVESAALRALPADERPTAFFRCWTRKEAYVKARGEGLSRPLHRFAIPFTAGTSATVRDPWESPEDKEGWHVRDLEPCLGYAAAVVVEGEEPAVDCRDWGLAEARDVVASGR